MVQWESLLELDAILHFEYHPLVRSYQEQPSVEIYYDKHGQQHKCYPDFRLTFNDESELYVEVKPSCDIATTVIRERLQAIARRFEEQGRRYRVMDETGIRRQPLLANLQALHESSKSAAQTISSQQLAKKLTGGPIWKLGDLINQLQGVQNVLRLVQAGYLLIDLEKPLSDDSDICSTDAGGGSHGSFRI
jgi:hypothetical protein